MPRKLNMVGRRFGLLIVTAEDPVRRNPRSPQWFCQCDCGVVSSVTGGNLRQGNTQSCGCLRREALSKTATRHGGARPMQRIPEYVAWVEMRKRCLKRDLPAYPDYGGRGIMICPEWSDFAVFYRDMGDRPSPHHSLDRINNDGPYSPENCRWATKTEQARNTRSTRRITLHGVTRPMADWADLTGIPISTLRARIDRYGWSAEDALTKPIRLR